MPEQRRREPNKFAIVDEELLGNKQSKKLFRAAAYSMGLGVGFFLILPILPEIGDKTKSQGMIHIFHVISMLMIMYSLSIAFGYFFLRAHVKLVVFILNWVLMPLVGLWCITEGYKIVTGP